MRPFSFIHAADLHIDSPFRGVTAKSSSTVGKALYASTFGAFDKLIDITRDRRAEFLLIAGDVYDGEDRSLRAQMRLRDGLAKLDGDGIQSFIVHGNHDPLSGHTSALDWPKRAHFFGAELASVPALGSDEEPVATVSGISYPTREESRNLASKFTKQATGLFQIGLLHCNVAGTTGHDDYAPCNLTDLRAAGMDYWALGHVHTREVLAEDPWVVYPGNIQGRSIRERHARGCYHVSVDEHGKVTMEFVALDRVRWSLLEVSIDDVETIDALERAILEEIEQESARADGRDLVCRLSLIGRGPLHGELRRARAEVELEERIRDRLSGDVPFTWVEQIRVRTRPNVDLAERMKEQDLLAEVLTTSKDCRDAPEGMTAVYNEALDELWGHSRMKKHLERPTDGQIRTILGEAEMLCLDLLEDDS